MTTYDKTKTIEEYRSVEESSLKQVQKWLETLGQQLEQLGSLLSGRRPALQPIPIRSRPQPPRQ